MNQIMVTKKLYITPALVRKKRYYKIYFLLSIFCVCILFSYYIYGEYDRNKSEEVSKDILAQLNFIDDTTVSEEKIVVILNDEEDDGEEIKLPEVNGQNIEILTTASGDQYYTLGIINIPKIEVNYPILSKYSDELLKIAPCKFWGPEINKVGNFCIVGHNYRNSKFFSKVPKLENGDIIEIIDLTGATVRYEVYDKYQITDTDVQCTSQLTEGRKDITLITCTDDSKNRIVVKATEV